MQAVFHYHIIIFTNYQIKKAVPLRTAPGNKVIDNRAQEGKMACKYLM